MKKQVLTTLSVILLCTSITARTVKADYRRSDSTKVVSLLMQAGRKNTPGEYMIHFARQLRGLPYVGKTLEKNQDERLVVNLSQLDCTTYVESVLALTMCARQGGKTFEDYCRNLQQIRYANGEISYTRRLHYFTYWITENVRKGIVRNVGGDPELFAATQTVNAHYMTTHPDLYPMLSKRKDRLDEIGAMERAITGNRYAYIPKDRLGDGKLLRKTIHNGDIIVILTSRKGLDTSHIGIAVWHADGLHMLNASSIHKKVVEEKKTLRQYMMEHKTHTGIRIVRPM